MADRRTDVGIEYNCPDFVATYSAPCFSSKQISAMSESKLMTVCKHVVKYDELKLQRLETEQYRAYYSWTKQTIDCT